MILNLKTKIKALRNLNCVFFVYLNVRTAAFISAFYYFVITVGISISLHFCKGELTCFSFISENISCCHILEETNEEHDNSLGACEDDCCSNENVTITLDTEFTFEVVDIPNAANSLSNEGVHFIKVIDSQTLALDAPARGSPKSFPLYLLHSSFIFYG